jgi:phosphoglycolate phosphatase
MHAICFDLDGTLTDPKIGISRSIRHAMRKLGREVPRSDDLTWCIGPPLLGSFEKLLGNRADAKLALSHYRERFSEVGIYENDLYPGITAALSNLASSGRRMFVATSKPKVFADRIIEHFALAQYFEAIYGAELDGSRAAKSELLAWLVSREHLSAEATVMVGDRIHDIVAARNIGMLTLGVLYGYGTRAELVAAGADRLCESPHELTMHLEAMLPRTARSGLR